MSKIIYGRGWRILGDDGIKPTLHLLLGWLIPLQD